MSNWKNWLKHRELREGLGEGGDPVSDFKFNSPEGDYADDYDHIQSELFKAVMSRYKEEAMQFFEGIAQRDMEIANLLRKLQQDEPTQMKEPEHPDEGDEVVPPGADTGYNSEFGGGD